MEIDSIEAKGYSDKILKHWQSVLHFDATIPDDKNYKKFIKKEDFVWTVLAVVCEKVETDFIAETLSSRIRLRKNATICLRSHEKNCLIKLYREHLFEAKYSRKKAVYEGLHLHFKTDEEAKLFVDINFERKRRNMICRRIRMTRKANLQDFNFFVTFTYDDKLHTEESFRQKLKNCLSLLSSRKSWKYIGVWERSPEKKRLHFHGILDISEGTMPGYFVQKEDYSFNSHRRQIANQDTYFLENFGRNDFEKIVDQNRIGEAMAYLMKYLEKSGERIVYSKGLPQYFITDIMDEDIVCPIGMEEQKLLLFDDFGCWDEDEYIGQVSKETIAKMPKAN